MRVGVSHCMSCATQSTLLRRYRSKAEDSLLRGVPGFSIRRWSHVLARIHAPDAPCMQCSSAEPGELGVLR